MRGSDPKGGSSGTRRRVVVTALFPNRAEDGEGEEVGREEVEEP